MSETVLPGGLLITLTADGVAVELHSKHLEPLLAAVRYIKTEVDNRRRVPGHVFVERGVWREIEYRLERAQDALRYPKCVGGCNQHHPVVVGTPHPSGHGFICDDPHETEVPHACGYWAARCRNGAEGMKAKAAANG